MAEVIIKIEDVGTAFSVDVAFSEDITAKSESEYTRSEELAIIFLKFCDSIFNRKSKESLH
jgi:hypothetical protein